MGKTCHREVDIGEGGRDRGRRSRERENERVCVSLHTCMRNNLRHVSGCVDIKHGMHCAISAYGCHDG